MTGKGNTGDAKRGVTGAVKEQKGGDKRGEGGVLKQIKGRGKKRRNKRADGDAKGMMWDVKRGR